MKESKKNLSASVTARLLNRAKQTGEIYQTVLTNFCLERFLYRLAQSHVRDRFVLKGAMLLRVWSDRPYRTTRDLDLLRLGDSAHVAIREDLHTICTAIVEADGIVFDPWEVSIEPIRAEDEYAGVRAVLPARCGTARMALQIDMGVGDHVWPEPHTCPYPTLLDFPPPEILAYPKEAVVAEKLEAMVVLGDRNSRIKDFFDLYYLAGQFTFDRAILTESIRRTFIRRGTAIPAEVPIGLTRRYWENPSRPTQVRAFARRAALDVPDDAGEAFHATLGAFLWPILCDLHRGERRQGSWPPGGPWTDTGSGTF